MISSTSNSWTREAWIAAPRAVNSEGFIAAGNVDGARTFVVAGKIEDIVEAILGV